MINLPTVQLPVRWRKSEWKDGYAVQSCTPDKALELIKYGQATLKDYVDLLLEQDHGAIEQLALFARWWNDKDSQERTHAGQVFVDTEDVGLMKEILISVLTKEIG